LSPSQLKQLIHEISFKLGFTQVGISAATHDYHKSEQLHQWLKKGYHASMKWVENREKERSDINTYFPEAKSVISVSMNYFTGNAHQNNTGKISNYAWGDDYHNILKPRLHELLNCIKSEEPNAIGLVCVDTSPVMEKAWAQKSGLGWIGKHTNLITRDFGSWVFLGEVLINLELEPDLPFLEDLCGSCTACLDACPTQAFPKPYILDSSKCISYLTIEHRGPFQNQSKLSDWIYGCDICQEVCPWNIKFSTISNESSFQPRKNLQGRSIKEWSLLTEEQFKTLFKGSAVKRTKYQGLKRNIESIIHPN